MEARDVITSQHLGKTQFMKWLESLASAIVPLGDTHNVMQESFDLDQAVGTQLDVIGEIVNVSRRLNFKPADGRSPVLDDDMYRFLIRARIIRNKWDGTTESLMNLWNTIYPDIKLLMMDHQDMTITMALVGIADQFAVEIISHGYILPKPACVQVTYSANETQVFGYGPETDLLAGYGKGYWAVTISRKG